MILLKKDVYNAKIKDIEDKIPHITNVATDTTLNAKINEVKNKIPKLTAEEFEARLAQANLEANDRQIC